MEFSNINKELDIHICDYLDEQREKLADDYEMDIGTIYEVEHRSYDGFIPFTNGGYRLIFPVTLEAVSYCGASYKNEKVNKELDDAVDYSYLIALESFIDNNRDELAGLYPDLDLDDLAASRDVITYHDLYDKDKGMLAEELSEGESECLTEGSTFFIELRVQYYNADNLRNETGKDEACFMAGINTDYEYGRDKGLEVMYEVTVPLADLGFEKAKELVTEMYEAVS
jgi:hypothetical protein